MHTKETVKKLLETSDKAVERGLIVLLSRQTLDEVVSENTKHRNGQGFSAFDAEFMTSLAKQVERKQGYGYELGKCLSEKQMAHARKKIVRYAGQLAEVANEKAGVEKQPSLLQQPADAMAERVYWKDQENARDAQNDAKAAAFEVARDRIANFVFATVEVE